MGGGAAVTIDDAVYATIRRLFFGEHWKSGTIAAQLGVHPDAVRRAIDSDAFNNKRPGPTQDSLRAPYRDLIQEQLKLYPTLRATRVQGMLKGRGTRVAMRRCRAWSRPCGPRARGRPTCGLRPLPGEQAEGEWGHFGVPHIGQVKRPLSCFVTVLSHGRAMYARFFLDQGLSSFLLGHVLAAPGQIPRASVWSWAKPSYVFCEFRRFVVRNPPTPRIYTLE